MVEFLPPETCKTPHLSLPLGLPAEDKLRGRVSTTLSRLVFFFLLDWLQIKVTMLRKIEIVAVRIRSAGFGEDSSVWPWFRQFRVINFLHVLDNCLSAFHFKAEVIQADGRSLIGIR